MALAITALFKAFYCHFRSAVCVVIMLCLSDCIDLFFGFLLFSPIVFFPGFAIGWDFYVWQLEHQCVLRPASLIRSIAFPHLGHGCPVRL